MSSTCKKNLYYRVFWEFIQFQMFWKHQFFFKNFINFFHKNLFLKILTRILTSKNEKIPKPCWIHYKIINALWISLKILQILPFSFYPLKHLQDYGTDVKHWNQSSWKIMLHIFCNQFFFLQLHIKEQHFDSSLDPLSQINSTLFFLSKLIFRGAVKKR